MADEPVAPAAVEPTEEPVVLTPVGNEPAAEPIVETPAKVEPVDDSIDVTESPDTIKYKEKDISFEVDQTLAKELAEKGLDLNIAIEELASSKDFTLSKGLRAKFDKEFGKGLVDHFITGLQLQLDSGYTELTTAETNSEARTAKALEETYEQVGGEEAWKDLESWLIDGNGKVAVSDEDMASFNEVMTKGNRYSQKLAIDNMMDLKNNDTGDVLDLIKSDTSVGTKDWLSFEEYHQLISTKEGLTEYNKDPAKYDAMRSRAHGRGL